MKQFGTRKLCYAGILCAVAVVGSFFYIPVFGEQMCAGAAHGKYSVCGASGTVLRRGCCILRKLNPKSSGYRQFDGVPPAVCLGALLCGLMFWKTKNIPLTLLAEVFGTAILGGLCAYPVAILFYGNAGRADCVFMPMSFRF